METTSVNKTQLERPYTAFLFKSLWLIFEAWDQDQYRLALSRACKLVVFLPSDIKEVLWPQKEKIQNAIRKASRTQSVDFFTTHLVKNRAALRVAGYYLEPFVDEMVRLLDEKGWLERGALRPRFQDKRKLGIVT